MRKKKEEKEKEKLLKAGEWAREEGKNPLDFVWWDKNENVITNERYNEIKKQIYR